MLAPEYWDLTWVLSADWNRDTNLWTRIGPNVILPHTIRYGYSTSRCSPGSRYRSLIGADSGHDMAH
jgi:hypothetical protein